ncbi:hypothetical protein F66182_4413 [Fusarium sp. NRRL 66182]|nr:hypothetical protein F66182_4413 [Fusarium sp. NRRL 66182]
MSLSPMPLLKTCQTCFHLKIRCEKTQDSDSCDRCLRLGKTCVFNQARRRRNVNRQRTRMTPYFPFVVFPPDAPVETMNSEHPCACLAALAAASHADAATQQALGTLFNQVVAARIADGRLKHLDLLQGLLINLAWAHYQPRPMRYTQYLHLATSIVSDLRLDRPRRPKLWSVDGGKDKNEPDWGPDEMRALAGVYYLSSRSSCIILQKSRQVFDTSYISNCCDRLILMNQYPTDKYLPFIMNAQTLVGKVDDVVCRTSTTNNGLQFYAEIQDITQRCTDIKSSLPFPMSESRQYSHPDLEPWTNQFILAPLLLQIHMLELLLSQSSPRGTSFGLDKFQDQPQDQYSLIDWLSASMSAARSLISITLLMPQGEEVAMSNMGWIMIHCGLNMAVRLDLIAARGSISRSTQHLRRFLDMPHTLRQVVLRLEATPGPEAPADHPFNDLAKRVRRLEEWYLAQAERQSAESTRPPVCDQPTNMPVGVVMPYQESGMWPGGSEWYQGMNLDMSTFLFADPIDYPGNLGYMN